MSILKGLICILAVFTLVWPAHAEGWLLFDDMEGSKASWTAERGTAANIRTTTEQARSGKRSLAVTLLPQQEGRMVRADWMAELGDVALTSDSRVRFWMKGSPLAKAPHGGILLVERGGKVGGGDSHWMLELPGELYSSKNWTRFQTKPVAQANNPEWAPDANGQPDLDAIVALLFVAQEDGPGEHLQYTVFFDEVELSETGVVEPHYTEATVQPQPDHITPLWRGFQGREREYPAAIDFTDIMGWRAATWGEAGITMQRSEEEPCYEDLRYQAKLTYWCKRGPARYALIPPQPIQVEGPANAAVAWVWGNNWDWMPHADTPSVYIWVSLVDSTGQHHRLNLGIVNFRFYGMLHKRVRDNPFGDPGHRFWGGAGDGKLHAPFFVENIEIENGSNPEPRTIYLESVAFYQDDKELPEFRPELIEHLPFPTTIRTIAPDVKQLANPSVRQDGAAWVLRSEGDETLTWRYEPATGTLSDLAVKVGEKASFIPCAGGGPTVLLAGQEYAPGSPLLQRKLLSTKQDGDGVRAVWRVSAGGESTEYALRLAPEGKSLIVDWSSPEAKVTGLLLGHASGLKAPQLFRVPYLVVMRDIPQVLLDQEVFCLTLLDWYNTESSGLNWIECGVRSDGAAVMNGGSYYMPLTDGTRNRLGERQFINVSSDFLEVLPNIPNPPSDQREVLKTNLYCHVGGVSVSRFQEWLKLWQGYKRRGIDNVLMTHHEDAWSNGNDVGQGQQEYTFTTEAAPEIGDEQLIEYCSAVKELGWHVGLYENFTDYNPLGKSWDIRNATRQSTGELQRAWPPTYAPSPLKALEGALYYPRAIREKFGCNTAYRDCHTAFVPWGEVDFRAGTPGAGKFSTNFRAWGALLDDGSAAYEGPVVSEGLHQCYLAGLVDSSYGQLNLSGAESYPLLVDFGVRKLSQLGADVAMSPSWVWGRGLYNSMAASIAYGHIGYLPPTGNVEAGIYYHLMQQLQARYVMEPVESILYHQAGRLEEASQALKSGAWENSQVLISYENGLQVAINCNPEQVWEVELGGKRYQLAPDSWAAVQGEEFETCCTVEEGHRVGWLVAPEYRFYWSEGVLRSFGEVETDGAIAFRPQPDGTEELIVLSPYTRLKLSKAAASVTALGEQRDELDLVTTQAEGEGMLMTPVAGAVSYLLRKQD